jgi:hypothetical protein
LYIDDFYFFCGQMGSLDAPRLGIEVVGTIADILHRTEGDTFVSDGDEATRGIRWQDESFATQVFQGFGVREVYVERGWRKEERELFCCRQFLQR